MTVDRSTTRSASFAASSEASALRAGVSTMTKSTPRSLAALSALLGLIRFGGHLPKGEYDVDHDGDAGQADAAELHG